MSEQTTMLERLGRVVESTIGEMSSYDYTLNYDHPSGMLGSEYLARAVIEALMEPTPEMLLACWPNYHPWGKNAPPPAERPDMVRDMSATVTADWQAMLRTILSQPTKDRV